MKIVYISNSIIPSYTANSIQVMKMCQALKNKGYDIELYCPRHKKDKEFNNINLWNHYGINKIFPIIKIPLFGWQLKQHIYGLYSMLKAIKSKTDIVITRHLPSAAIASLFKIPVILELHELPGGYSGHLYLKIFFLFNNNKNKLIVSISENLKKDILLNYKKWKNSNNTFIFYINYNSIAIFNIFTKTFF